MGSMFERTAMLLGEEKLDILKRSRVIVFGVGGVGGYAVEMLSRSGIGTIAVVDNDTVAESNLNRQIIALRSTIGRTKVDVIEGRIKDINSECRVEKYPVFYLPENSSGIDFSRYDYVIDAIDTVSAKIDLVKKAKESDVRIISSMGTGNKLDPGMLEVSDIYRTSVCPLARVMRRLCRENDIKKLKVVYSKEESKGTVIQNKSKRTPGSFACVPAAAGILIASEVIRDLLETE